MDEVKIIKAMEAVRKRPMMEISNAVLDALMSVHIEAAIIDAADVTKAQTTSNYFTRRIEAAMKRMACTILSWLRTLLGVKIDDAPQSIHPSTQNGEAWMMRLPYIGRLAFVGMYII